VSEQRPETFLARPRPLADAPVESLEARAEELAKRWAIALVGARPLAEVTTVPLEEIARVGPALCVAVARALGSEAAFDALMDARDARAASLAEELHAIASRWDAARIVECVEALRRVVWAAASTELGEASPRTVAELSDRLASVCAELLARALAAPDAAALRTGTGAAPASSPAGRVLYASPPLPGRSGATLIDEHGEQHTSLPPREEPAATTTPRPLPWDTPLGTSGPADAEVRAARAADERTAVQASRRPRAR
jgi:hypothetical protein